MDRENELESGRSRDQSILSNYTQENAKIWKIFTATSMEVIMYIHWTNIPRIKSIFLAKKGNQNAFHAEETDDVCFTDTTSK